MPINSTIHRKRSIIHIVPYHSSFKHYITSITTKYSRHILFNSEVGVISNFVVFYVVSVLIQAENVINQLLTSDIGNITEPTKLLQLNLFTLAIPIRSNIYSPLVIHITFYLFGEVAYISSSFTIPDFRIHHRIKASFIYKGIAVMVIVFSCN